MENIYALVAQASKQLKRAGKKAKALELQTKIKDCQSYDEAVGLVYEYLALVK